MTRCLIVDDEEQNRYLLDVLLRGHGYETELAENGMEALEKARVHPPDIVISDLLMPVMDGFTLCRAWKSDETLKKIPFVVYTATYTESKDEALALSAGADRFLIKPQDPDSLLKELTRVLDVFAAGALAAAGKTIHDDEFTHHHYNAVIRKLEDKMAELERLNARLNREIDGREKAQASAEKGKVYLAEAEDKYRHIFENAVEGIFQAKPDGRLISVNPAFVRMFGYDTEETLFAEAPSIDRKHYVNPEDRERLINALRDPGVVSNFEVEVYRRDGMTLWVSVNGHVVRDDRGTPLFFEGTVIDITKRRKAEEALRKLNEELEQRVAQRTAELQAANQELEAFSYSVSHDLRAPLRSIDGFSRALEEDYLDQPLDDAGKDYIHRIRRSTRLMDQLVNDLLKLSRITRADFRNVPLDLSGMVREQVDKLRQEQPDVVVEMVIQEGVSGRGDADLMAIALQNLLSNAWKYTGKTASPRVEFGAMQQEGKTVYYVRDNGAGFDPVNQGRLFGAFQRLHSATEFPGTGIGLATVRRIINRHGGRTWAEGAVGQGAAFYFTLC